LRKASSQFHASATLPTNVEQKLGKRSDTANTVPEACENEGVCSHPQDQAVYETE